MPRYPKLRSPEIYGKAVERHLSAAKRQLEAETPRRDGLLRLLKDIAEYMQCTKTDEK